MIKKTLFGLKNATAIKSKLRIATPSEAKDGMRVKTSNRGNSGKERPQDSHKWEDIALKITQNKAVILRIQKLKLDIRVLLTSRGLLQWRAK